MSVTVTQELTQQTVTVTGNPVENNVTVTVSNARGPAGPNSVTSATTSDGTANLSLAAATVSGTLTAPTAATTTSTTQVATTAFVQQELASGVGVAKNLEFLARNGSGATIAKGSIVYINGAVSGIPRITKSQANNDTNSARTIGFVKQDILDGANGFVIIEGELQNVSTADSSGIIGAGIQLYLSPTTPGAFTRTKPSAPNHLVYVGVVVTASTGANLDGKILVGIQNGYELDEIHDVSITSPAAGQVIKRNAGNTLWINQAVASADVSDATSAATADKLVRRDASGGADFSGTVNMAIGVVSDLRFEDYQAAVGATFIYNGTSASDHRIALGAGPTGATLFGAADAAAARTTLGLATTDSVTFAAATMSSFTGPSGLVEMKSGATWQKLRLYSTTDNANNYEYITVTDSGANWRIGNNKLGTGPTRAIALVAQGSVQLGSNGGDGWSVNTSKHFLPDGTTNTRDLGQTTSRIRNLYVGTLIDCTGNLTASGTVKTGGYTFATLPTPTTGMRAYITDGALAPIYMANAAGGSTVVTPVFYNGTNWINA